MSSRIRSRSMNLSKDGIWGSAGIVPKTQVILCLRPAGISKMVAFVTGQPSAKGEPTLICFSLKLYQCSMFCWWEEQAEWIFQSSFNNGNDIFSVWIYAVCEANEKENGAASMSTRCWRRSECPLTAPRRYQLNDLFGIEDCALYSECLIFRNKLIPPHPPPPADGYPLSYPSQQKPPRYKLRSSVALFTKISPIHSHLDS